MPENVLETQARAIARHLSDSPTGGLPTSSEELTTPQPQKPVANLLARGDFFHTRGKPPVRLYFYEYTPEGSNGKPLAPRYRMVLQVGNEVRRFEFRGIKGSDSSITDQLQEFFEALGAR